MAYTILEQVKIQLRQAHTEQDVNPDGSTYDKVVLDNPEENPFLELCIEKNRQLLISVVKPPEHYSPEMIEEIVAKYSSAIVDMTIYDYCKEGAEFQKTHSENGISRNWISKEEILGRYNVRTIAKII